MSQALRKAGLMQFRNSVKPVLETTCITKSTALTHSLIDYFETIPNSKKLQTTTEMWLLNNFNIQIAQKTLWKK